MTSAATETAARRNTGRSADATENTIVSPPVPVPATAHDSPLVSIDHDISMVMPAQPSPEDDESSDEDDEEVDDESSSSGTDQEDDGANQEHFKQVLGAGVERISRHRD